MPWCEGHGDISSTLCLELGMEDSVGLGQSSQYIFLWWWIIKLPVGGLAASRYFIPNGSEELHFILKNTESCLCCSALLIFPATLPCEILPTEQSSSLPWKFLLPHSNSHGTSLNTNISVLNFCVPCLFWKPKWSLPFFFSWGCLAQFYRWWALSNVSVLLCFLLNNVSLYP